MNAPIPDDLAFAIRVAALDPEMGLHPQGFAALRDFVLGISIVFPDDLLAWIERQRIAQARAEELLAGITLDPANLPSYFTADWYRMLGQPWAEDLAASVAVAEEHLS